MRPRSRARRPLVLARVGLVHLTAGLALTVGFARHAALARGASSAAELLRAVDERQQNVGDWRSVVYLEQHEKGREPLVYETVSMRRSADHKFLMLFTRPKTVAGQGYLRIDRNLWFYDPTVGRWERRTEREHVGGTISHRSDFDEWHLLEEYEARDGGAEAVGQLPARRLVLAAKPGIDVAFPVIQLWVDEDAKDRPQAPGVRALRPAAADDLLPEVGPHLQPREEDRRLVPQGDPPLRRAGGGHVDPAGHQGGRRAAAAGERVHQGLAGASEPLTASASRVVDGAGALRLKS